jgi:biotin transporter BioY
MGPPISPVPVQMQETAVLLEAEVIRPWAFTLIVE